MEEFFELKTFRNSTFKNLCFSLFGEIEILKNLIQTVYFGCQSTIIVSFGKFLKKFGS
jgi:hypothetical protein